MDSKTAVFKDISCTEVEALIAKCATKTTDPITWGRLLQHCRKCWQCLNQFVEYHQLKIADISLQVVTRTVSAEHRHYPVATDVAMHFSRQQLEAFGTQMNAEEKKGGFMPDELLLIEQHVAACGTCKKLVPTE